MSNSGIDIKADDGAIIEGMNKISYTIHSIFPYFGLKKKAVDLYFKEIEKSSLPADAKYLAIANLRHNSRQWNSLKDISEIAINNARPGTDFSLDAEVSEEWLERYLDSAKYVTDSKIKLIWGKILSKEFENPGCISPNIINVLPSITSKYAELFSHICDMEVEIVYEKNGEMEERGKECIVPQPDDSNYFSDRGLTFFSINELDTLGLIKFHASSDYIIRSNNKNLICQYFGKKIICKSESRREFPIGCVMLTETGKIIRDVTERRESVGYYDTLKDYYLRKGISFEEI